MIELLVVVSIIVMLIALLMPALSSVREQARRAACASNTRQTSGAALGFAQDNNGRLPYDATHPSSALPWLWDMPDVTRDDMYDYGASRDLMYCPSNQEQNDDALYHYPQWWSVLGYYWLWRMAGPQPPLIGMDDEFRPQGYLRRIGTGPVSEMELITDATIAQGGNFTAVFGGWSEAHRTSHLDGTEPVGGNILYADGHGEWRPFELMLLRSPSPQQWF